MGGADRQGGRPRPSGHRSQNPAAESRHGPRRRGRPRRQRPGDADAFPQPAGRPLRAGRQFGGFAGRRTLPAGRPAAGSLGTHLRPVARNRRRGLAGRGARAGGNSGRQPPDQGYHGHPDPRHDVRFGRRLGRRDPAIPLRRSRPQVVRRLDDGIAGRRHGQPARPAASRRLGGPRTRRRRHQTAQPAAAGRKLRPDDGTEHPAHAPADLPLHRAARRNRHGVLRSRGIHRAGRSAPRAHGVRLGRPPDPDARLDARRRRTTARLRPRGQTLRPADQHHHGPDGHSGRDLRRNP